MRIPKVYGVRRFCSPGGRPDCFEVYEIATGECASFGCYRYEAEQSARFQNARAAGAPSITLKGREYRLGRDY